jgi:DNA polymerase
VSKNLFDEIIEFMGNKAEQEKYTFVQEETLNGFFSNSDAPIREEENNDFVQETSASPAGAAKDISKSDLEELQQTVAACSRCRLHSGRLNTVFGEGAPNADLMFIGEGPGRDEDIQGRPFVGKAGQLLTKMINAMQFSREEVFIGNIVKCRPPGNRNPEPDEAEQCLPYLKRQIELIRPKVLVLLGAVPLLHLLNKKGITRLHGQWFKYMGIKTMPTLHPAYLLRNPAAKKDAWDDLQKVMKEFGKTPPPKR